LGKNASAASRVILASASARRRELLEQIGYATEVEAPDIDEQAIRHPDPTTLVQLLASAKLRAVCARPGSSAHRAPEVPVIAADTVVLCGERILEKPSSESDAHSMIRLLSGQTHQVLTGVAVRLPGRAKPIVRYAETHVTFAKMSKSEIAWYISTGEWRGVAGGYRIQDGASRFITTISGSYSNVVGLPLHLIYSILRS